MDEADVIRFASLDDGAEVLASAHANEQGQVSLAIDHELDGDLELFMTPGVAARLASALARAAAQARGGHG